MKRVKVFGKSIPLWFIVAVLVVTVVSATVAVISNILHYETEVVPPPPPPPMEQPIVLEKIDDLPSTVVIDTPYTVSFRETNVDPNYAYTCTTYFKIICTTNPITPEDVEITITVHYVDEPGKPDWTTTITLTQGDDYTLEGSLGPWEADIGHENVIDVTVTFHELGTYYADVWVEGTPIQ